MTLDQKRKAAMEARRAAMAGKFQLAQQRAGKALQEGAPGREPAGKNMRKKKLYTEDSQMYYQI